MNVPSAEAEARSSVGSVSPGSAESTATAEVRDTAGVQGRSVMAGGDAGVAPPSDIAGEEGAMTNVENATRNEGSLRHNAGLNVDTPSSVSPESQVGVMQNREFHARDQVSATAEIPSSEVSDVKDAVRNPTGTASARGEAELRSEVADRRPDAVVEGEQRAATARATREAARNPEQVAENEIDDAIDDKIDEKKDGAQASVGVKVTTTHRGDDET